MKGGGNMTVIKRVNPISIGKLQGILGAVIGLLVGLMFAAISGLITPALEGVGQQAPRGLGVAMGGFAIILMPITYGIGGFIGGIIGGFLYNIVAKWVGGIEIDLEQKP